MTAYFAEGTDAMHKLEAMVDKVGVRNVLWALGTIAHAKAEHLSSAWQDHVTARDWTKAANYLNRAAGKCPRTALDTVQS